MFDVRNVPPRNFTEVKEHSQNHTLLLASPASRPGSKAPLSPFINVDLFVGLDSGLLNVKATPLSKKIG